jgi:Holliday junction resolvase-like predicted endonuclease
MKRIDKGNVGQKLACEWLKKRQFEILSEKYRPTLEGTRVVGAGEIDVLAKRVDLKSELWVIEVKTRTEHDALPLVHAKQLIRLRRSALAMSGMGYRVRLALMVVHLRSALDAADIEFIENPC